ncbi:hypothetical protein B296_00041009 [Ensete ventricosum]|uniref:Uncharacterized protein n=2 Tax=Ensete ventricosum TaxID=4639 RepID=A0A426YFL7_ENSVE|nr:hypothetical protein B296_00041009 [Ensete ventricosum]
METLIDITPRDPLPEPSAGPLDLVCAEQGLIVCDKEKIRGQQGVSLDALVGVFTRLGQEMDEIGLSRSYRLAEKVASVVEEAQPLLAKVRRKFGLYNKKPLVTRNLEFYVSGMHIYTHQLLSSCRKVQSAILTPENAELIKQSVYTLVFTLKNIETVLVTTTLCFQSISSDISGFTGDETTRRNLKLLIKSLSRLL